MIYEFQCLILVNSPLYHSPRTGLWVAWVQPPACGRQLLESQQGSLGPRPLRSTPGENRSKTKGASYGLLPAIIHLRVTTDFLSSSFVYFTVIEGYANTDLVQRSHRNLGDIIGDELPGRALRVAGSETLSVPQVTYRTLKMSLLPLPVIFSNSKGSTAPVLTVFIHSEDRGPAHRELSEGLLRRGRDVIPAFPCRRTVTPDAGLHLDHYCAY